jgi:hypothetical protein
MLASKVTSDGQGTSLISKTTEEEAAVCKQSSTWSGAMKLGKS